MAGKFRTLDQVPVVLDGRWLVDGVLPLVGVGMLYGPPQQGKSFVAVDLACRIASGMPWAGLDVERGRVAYLASEDYEGIRTRIEAWRLKQGVPIANFSLALAPGPFDITNSADVQATVADLSGGPPIKLLIIDTLSKSLGDGDDQSRADVYKVLAHAEAIAQQLQCCVLLVYHTARPQANARTRDLMPRGASSWEAGLGHLLVCAKGSVFVKKVKNGRDGYQLAVEQEVVAVGNDSRGRGVTSLVTTVAPEAPSLDPAKVALSQSRGQTTNDRRAAEVRRRVEDRLKADGLGTVAWDKVRALIDDLPDLQGKAEATLKSARTEVRKRGKSQGWLDEHGNAVAGALSPRGQPERQRVDGDERVEKCQESSFSYPVERDDEVNTPKGVCSSSHPQPLPLLGPIESKSCEATT